ncbi:unnamed protein product, partial [Brassica rapa subsp. narinosa]
GRHTQENHKREILWIHPTPLVVPSFFHDPSTLHMN